MFPNFESQAQREQKCQDLLERAQRRVRQASAKRNMYAGAQWASDTVKGIITVPKKSTESTQTDISVGPDEETPDELKVPLSEILKNNLSDKNSNKNPEVSTTPEVDVKAEVVDAEVDARPQMADVAINVSSSVVDVGIDNTPEMIGVEVGPDAPMKTKKTAKDSRKVSKKDLFNDEENDEIFEQKRAKQMVAEIFEFYPILADLRIHPLASTRRQLTRYYIGKDANTYQVKSNKLVLVPSIDWNETFDHIGKIMKHDIRFRRYVKEENKRGEMNFEDENTPYQLWQRIGAKRKRVNASTGDDANRSEQRLQDSYEFDNSTSTQSDEMSSKLKMLWTISKNKEMLVSNGLKKKIAPVLIGTTKSSPMDEDGYVWIDGNSISVYSKSSDRVKPAITKKVNWQATLQTFVSMVNDKGLELVFIGKKDEEHIAKDFKPGVARSEPRHGVLSGIDEDMDPKSTNADSDAKQILTDYYRILQEKRVKIPFRLKPMVVTRKGVKSHSEYYFSEPMLQRPLNIRNGQHKAVSGNAWKESMKNIRWMDTFASLSNRLEEIEHYLNDEGDHDENPLPMDEKEASAYLNGKKQDKARRKNLEDNLAIINEAILKSVHDIKRQSIEKYEHDDRMQKALRCSVAAFKEYEEALTHLEEAKKVVKSSNSKAARSALRAATSAMKATKAVYIFLNSSDIMMPFVIRRKVNILLVICNLLAVDYRPERLRPLQSGVIKGSWSERC